MFRLPCAIRKPLSPLVAAMFVSAVLFSATAQVSPKPLPRKASASSAAAGSPAKPSGDADQLLPRTFAGWDLSGNPQQSTNPTAADAANGAVLREYGFSRYESSTYTRDNSKVTVRAIEFEDATGAFGAFTFYRRPNMLPEKLGLGAAFDGSRVLFWQGTMLVDAKFSRLTAMSVSELRDLASLLPTPTGNQGTLPTLPNYLPQKHLETRTLEYAVGPLAYQQSGGVLPPSLVDFGRSAETVTAQYNAMNGMGTLTIINYPTPEIAMDRQRAIQSYFASARKAEQSGAPGSGQNSWTPALMHSNPAAIQSRRSGPLVAVTSGSFSAEDAQQILQRVHYEVNLTMSNRTTYRSDSSMVAQIFLDVVFMLGIFALIAVVSAISLGGFRIAWRKMRGKSAIAENESEEFLRLNLKD
ncbi:MAG TPA: DUF6599 family protein [Acidobacteriaceae bacterium]|nr:DUF6599 family protein [Acidobacteriaceae bacterium]